MCRNTVSENSAIRRSRRPGHRTGKTRRRRQNVSAAADTHLRAAPAIATHGNAVREEIEWEGKKPDVDEKAARQRGSPRTHVRDISRDVVGGVVARVPTTGVRLSRSSEIIARARPVASRFVLPVLTTIDTFDRRDG